MTIADGYLDLFEEAGASEQHICIERIRRIIQKIERQIAFTREYERLGSQEPIWQDLDGVLRVLDLPESVTFLTEGTDRQIYADPMLGKVFTNLLDNTLRHGGENVTRIRVTAEATGDELLITWEDDGVGIPVEEKERIFVRGEGKNTGLGLFPVREILALTGIMITESGTPGERGRFEIRVPAGRWRASDAARNGGRAVRAVEKRAMTATIDLSSSPHRLLPGKQPSGTALDEEGLSGLNGLLQFVETRLLPG